MQPQTIFASGINPFTGLGALPKTQPEPVMQKPTQPHKTKRADEDHSTPYTPPVATPALAVKHPPKKKPPVYVMPGELSITDDALPTGRTLPINKYHAMLSEMKPGQCVRCPTASVGLVAGAMRKFIEQKSLRAQIKSVTRFEGDEGFGRVWMLAAPAQALKAVA